MFVSLGKLVARGWAMLLVGWLALAAIAVFIAPPWASVVIDGEFGFLPEDSDSKRAELLFREAFPHESLASNIMIVAHRVTPGGISDADKTFITDVLKPGLEKTLDKFFQDESEPSSAATDENGLRDKRIVEKITCHADGPIGELFNSKDKQATLVEVELTTDFTDGRNDAAIEAVEAYLARIPDQDVSADGHPTGLQLDMTGSATVGRDMRRAARESAKATELWTVLLVMFLLIVIYRAPLLAIIPLFTVAVATAVSLRLLACFSGFGLVKLFAGIETYVTVLIYGAGVDYCLFLIARYKEELEDGATFEEAISNTLSKIGAALTASACTVMCGIGMLVFAQFGKFQQAGIAITFGLFVVLCASLTFTPALLRLAGRWAFWPNSRFQTLRPASGWLSPTSVFSRLRAYNVFQTGWHYVGQRLVQRPGTIWLVSVLAMLPFAILGVVRYSDLSYGLLTELPKSEPSVIGTTAIQQHFPAGEIGPVRMIVRHPRIDFNSADGRDPIATLTDTLLATKDQLRLAGIRSLAAPMGDPNADLVGNPKGPLAIARRAGVVTAIRKSYIGTGGDSTRIDLIFQIDPFSRKSISTFEDFKTTIPKMLPSELADAELSYVGPTPSIRDLKHVTDSDQIRIDVLVLAGVFLILVLLLRKPAISAYLIISVFFSYLATLGVTYALFWFLSPGEFAGLDWKVPMFLFTILIAVGEDYNIFLMTRIEEEQAVYGPVLGVTRALEKTGSIISSCGIIMAGTFSSLLAGSLVGMHQLGFALAFGVLLDTFVVRPVLVPAWLIMLHSGRFGTFGKLLGARPDGGMLIAEEAATSQAGEAGDSQSESTTRAMG